MNWFIPFIISVLILSCGSEPENKAIIEGINPDEPLTEIFKELRSEFRKIKLQCIDSVGCHPDLVLLGSIDGALGKFNYCNGINLGDGRVLTVSKCLPQNIVRNKALCQESVMLKTQEQKLYTCSKIVSIDIDTSRLEDMPETWSKDFVVLKFEELPSKGSVKLFKNTGVQEKSHELWGFELDKEKNIALLKKNKCKVVYANYIQPMSESRHSPSFSLMSCNDSKYFKKVDALGALMVDARSSVSQMNIIGLFSSGVTGRLERDLSNLEERFDNIKYSTFAEGFVSNIACWSKLYERFSDIPLDCHLDKFSNRAEEITYARDKMLRVDTNQSYDFQERLDHYTDVYSSEDYFLRWDMKLTQDENFNFFIMPRPKCFHNSREWLKDLKKVKVHTYNQDFVLAKISPKFDKDLLIVGSEEEVLNKYQVEFSVKNLRRKKYSDVLVIQKRGDVLINTYNVSRVPPCY